MTIVKTKKALRSAIDGKTYVKNILLLMAATLAYAPTARADELSDIQAQAKQLRGSYRSDEQANAPTECGDH